MTQFHKDDERFMRVALREAIKGLGKTSPNPAVGAVLVRNGRIISRGHHRGVGLAHAEVECIRRVRPDRRAKSTMYVTLEPCSTAGRTGACTTAIIESGIRSVVVGAIDPNPRHNGLGLAALRQAGIDVRAGVLAEECTALNPGFNKWIVSGRPFVIAKCAMGLDGRLTRPPKETRWVSSAASRRHAQQLRAKVDAILIGAETLRLDNPRLTLRKDKQRGRQPWRVILTRSGKLPKNARVFRDAFADRTLVYRGRPLGDVLSDLGRRDITSVLIEGGGDILGQALDARLIDQVQIYLAPILTGGGVIAFGGEGAADSKSALRLHQIGYEKIGDDICMTAVTTENPRNLSSTVELNKMKH